VFYIGWSAKVSLGQGVGCFYCLWVFIMASKIGFGKMFWLSFKWSVIKYVYRHNFFYLKAKVYSSNISCSSSEAKIKLKN
jgi:hypothetical protein